MAKLNVDLPEQLSKDFQTAIFERKGMKKGNIREAVIEALQDWIHKSAQ